MKGRDRAADPFTGELGILRDELATLASRIRTLHRRTEQLSTLRDKELQTGARMVALERLLDFDRVATHVRSAAARAELAGEPVPHLVAADLLPPDVYQALVDAIPARVFFEGRAAQGQELRVPPRLAPTPSIVTWMFLTDVVLRALSDLLIERFTEPLAAYTRDRFPSLQPWRNWEVEITLSEGRLVRRTPGYVGGSPADRPWDFLTGVVYLARHEDTDEYGSRLQATPIPFRANSALAYVGPPATHAYASIPVDAPADTERYTYEFGIGPTRDARRRLTALMGKAV